MSNQGNIAVSEDYNSIVGYFEKNQMFYINI